jgi:hypothetical protein
MAGIQEGLWTGIVEVDDDTSARLSGDISLVQNALLIPFQQTRFPRDGLLTGEFLAAFWSSSVTATNV